MFALERSFQRELARKCPDITFSQFMFLMAIQKKPESSQKIVADARQLTPAAISRQIDFLIKKGWVMRKKTNHSKREYTLSLTESGLKTLNKANNIIEQKKDRIFEKISDREFEQVGKVIDEWLEKVISDNIINSNK